MLRSLFSGISGLRANQTMMDVTGNNIANVNTTGFKSSQAIFEDTLSQLLRAAGAPQGGNGGTNPAQIGLGVRLAGISTNFTQGATQMTGRSTDLMINGDGFFAVKQGGQSYYTRAGSFSFDTDGRMVTQDGAVVQGWPATAGVINNSAAPQDIKLPIGQTLAPVATTTTTAGGNLPSDAAVGTVVNTSITMFDGQGNTHNVNIAYSKTAADTWSMAATDGAASLGTGTLTFSATGALTSATPIALAGSWGAVSLDVSGVTQYGGQNTISATGQNGSAMGSLTSFTLSTDGTLEGVFSNGLKQALGQISIVNFNNPPGLEKSGGSLYSATVNSGQPQTGVAGTGGRGTLSSGTLEMSNVDLAQEFTNLIIAQRGFQANSRVITTSDSILQDLVQMKQ